MPGTSDRLAAGTPDRDRWNAQFGVAKGSSVLEDAGVSQRRAFAPAPVLLALALASAADLRADQLPRRATASKGALLSALAAISDVDAGEAQIIMRQLGERSLEDSERGKCLRFLNSK